MGRLGGKEARSTLAVAARFALQVPPPGTETASLSNQGAPILRAIQRESAT